MAILFAKKALPFSCEVKHVIPCRLLFIRVQFENFKAVFVNVYAPTSGSERVLFLKDVNVKLQNCSSDEFLFWGGDFNCTENYRVDRNHLEPHAPSSLALKELIKTHCLCDVWRDLNNDVRQYTWAHTRGNFISFARLDRFYCFRHHCNIVKGCFITPTVFSDHCLVTCNVFIANVKPKSAYWHLNTSLFSDVNFRDVFVFFWKNFRLKKQCFKNLRQWWDCGKVEVKLLCQQYTFSVSRDITRLMKQLESEIMEEQGLVEATGEEGHIETFKTKTSLLADLLGIKAQGALVRSRFQNLTQMDAPSKFFFSLEKKNGQSRYIHSLRSENGQELSKTSDIRKCAVQFYDKLYRSEYRKDDVLSAGFYEGLPNVLEDSKAELERPLSEEELLNALRSMESGKTPGIDGLPVKFYKEFWAVLSEDLLAVLNESLVDGSLPLSCRRAVITLLPKKGDLQEIKNWRPVSLLCSDFKILSKTLANRLRKVMGQVIHLDQTYCVPGRSITDNVCLIRDVLSVSSLLGVNLGLISIDQEKAFDRVEHQYLWDTLEAFNFSSGFINMIKVLYQDTESLLKINGGLSAPFKVSRGIRQGCALSGMLYSLSIEPLLNSLRSRIKGLLLQHGIEHQISAYADDVVVMINGQQDINQLVFIVNDFRKISSAKVNWEKSEALAVGKWEKGLPNLPGGMIWRKEGFKYLGVYLGDSNIQQKNWEGVIDKVEGKLKKWKWIHSQLSFRGRVLIINNLVTSTLWHRLSCVDPPVGLLSRLQTILVNFFWEGLHWVPQSVLFLPKEDGGQGLVHLPSRHATFCLQFIQRFLTGPLDLVWRKMAEAILHTLDGLGLDAGLFLMDVKQLRLAGLPQFYCGLFKVWGLFNVCRLEGIKSLH